MDYKRLADLLFPNELKSPREYEEIYPKRNLPEGATVTRIGPSPTGFIHLGNLYNALIGERLSAQSGGVFFLRIEDTDSKRYVEGAVDVILSSMKFFGIEFDEGATVDGDNGSYGPYRQSLRKEIYHTFARELVLSGKAYPCFCGEDELEAMRNEQMAGKLNFGYYGKWAKCRDLSHEEIEAKIKNGEPHVLRFRSEGDENNRVEVFDGIRGTLSLQENYQDFVLLKSDGIPTYHFAHVVDDHLMRTTHVVRGEEWLSTLPIHVQLFDTLGWERPIYCHTAVLMKMDGETKRKLSKRKDPELALEYYRKEGYLPSCVTEYLMTVLNSNFEEWRTENPTAPIDDFKFTLEKMSNSGALFDLAKFDDVSREVLLRTPAEEIYEKLAEWAREYDPEFFKIFTADRDFSIKAISVGRSGDRPRKDLVNMSQARDFLSFYYRGTFKIEDEFPQNTDADMRKEIISRYLETLDFGDDKTAWFDKVRVIADDLGFALQPKKYKKNPELYNGSISDVSNVIRVALVGRTNSPDLWEISHVLGEDETRTRLAKAAEL